MKKTLAIIIFLFSSCLAFCQVKVSKEDKLLVGINVAPLGNTLIGNNPYFKKRGLGFFAGLNVKYLVNTNFSLLLNVNYERQRIIYPNGRFYEDGIFFDYNFDHKIRKEYVSDYISLPIVAQFKLGKNKVSGFINSGISISYLIRYGSSNYPADSAVGAPYYNYPAYSPIKLGTVNSYLNFGLGLGLVTGIGLNIPIKDRFEFSVEARNNLRLLNLNNYKSENLKTSLQSSLKTLKTAKSFRDSFGLVLGFAYKI